MLIAGGDRYDRLVSCGAVVTSADGIEWSVPTEPFHRRAKVVGLTHGPNNVIAISDAGWIASSQPTVESWASTRIWEGNFSPQSVCYATDFGGNDGRYMMVGQNKFSEAQGDFSKLDETGMIFTSMTGDIYDWSATYAHPETGSLFYGIRRITDIGLDAWIACGSVGGKPLVIYSLDGAHRWHQLSLPDNIGIRYAYDVTYTNSLFWFTTDGFILSTPSLSEPRWEASEHIAFAHGSSDLRKIMASSSGEIAAVCSGGIAYTRDRLEWSLLSVPGYRFRSIAWYLGSWYASAESNLTRYTIWRSPDLVSWTPSNNKVQAYDFTVV